MAASGSSGSSSESKFGLVKATSISAAEATRTSTYVAVAIIAYSVLHAKNVKVDGNTPCHQRHRTWRLHLVAASEV